MVTLQIVTHKIKKNTQKKTVVLQQYLTTFTCTNGINSEACGKNFSERRAARRVHSNEMNLNKELALIHLAASELLAAPWRHPPVSEALRWTHQADTFEVGGLTVERGYH